jgi:hypothetical protein
MPFDAGARIADCVQIPFGNSGPAAGNHLPNIVHTFVVRKSDNAIVTGSDWDEGTHATAVIEAGEKGVTVHACAGLMGWGALAQGHVAINSDHIYAAVRVRGEPAMQNRQDMISPPVGTAWWGVSAYDHECKVVGGTFPLYKNFLKLHETIIAAKEAPSTDTPITGLVASDTTVYVAIGSMDTVYEIDAKTSAVKGSFTVTAPGPMQIDAKGHLWILRNRPGKKDVVQVDHRGKPTGKVIADAGSATALGLSASNELIVSGGLDVRFYKITKKPKLERTWSAVTTGYDGTPGPFRWRGALVGATGEANGNVIVVWMHAAHAVYESYTEAGQLNWQKVALVADEASAPILNDDQKSADVYTASDVFTVRWDTTPPGWTWKGHVCDPLTNPNDSPQGSMMVQKVGDRRLVMKANHSGGGPVTLLTHSTGTLLQPRVTYPMDKPGTNWYWHLEPNGDLVEVLATSGFYYFTFKGYDASGAPTHDKSALLVPPDPAGDQWGGTNPDPFDRVVYDAPSDTLLVAGHTMKKPRGKTWGEFRVLVAYAGFGAFLRDGDRSHLTERWRLDLPYPDDFAPYFAKNPGNPRGLWVIGDAVVVQFMETETLAEYALASGAYLGQYCPNVASWLDVNAGLQGVALPDGRMFLTTLSITQESALGLLGTWKAP